MVRPLRNDLTGQRYGRLYVDRRSDSKARNVMWHCICDCGRTTEVQTYNLLFGMTRSCGCYRSERRIEMNRRFK